MTAVRVTLKLATSLDGRIALAEWRPASGSRSSAARARSPPTARANHDAVIVGVWHRASRTIRCSPRAYHSAA
jgi:riboflavin biosynthesis pyrimidine reductase